MIIKFATKRDINGNRHYLAIDTDKKQFARESRSWYCREDITAEISKTDRRNMIEKVKSEGYTEIDYM